MVCDDEDDCGWFAEDDGLDVPEGWFVEDEALDGEDDDPIDDDEDEDGWFVEAEEDDGWLVDEEEPIEEPLAPEAPLEPSEPLEPADELEPEALLRPGMSAPAACACWIAACVRGPILPSTGPGSKPLSFSACCSWRVCSSPPWLADAEAPCEEPLSLEADWLLEADLPLEADWPLEAGWSLELAEPCADCDVLAPLSLEDDEEGWLFAARAVPAAISAATRASFLNSMEVFLSSMKVLPARRAHAKCARWFGISTLDSADPANIRSCANRIRAARVRWSGGSTR